MAKVVLSKVLKKKNITRYRFAKLLGQETSNTARFYKPDYNPRLSTLEAWAKVLNVSVKDFIED